MSDSTSESSIPVRSTMTVGASSDERHKCFMCGILCSDETTLDTHVIRCAKGQLNRRREDDNSSVPRGGGVDTSCDTITVGGDVQPPSSIGSHDVSFEVPPTIVENPLANVAQASPVFDGIMDPTEGHSDHRETPLAGDGGAARVHASNAQDAASSSPRPRRRRAHTAHDVEGGTEEEIAIERRRRRCFMEEQLMSLESMQQANQERLRRPAAHVLNYSLDGSIAESAELSSTPMSTSTPMGGARGMAAGMRARPQGNTAAGGSSGGTADSPNTFLRNHTSVVWTADGGHSPSPKGSGKHLTTMERSSSAMTLPSDSGARRGAIPPPLSGASPPSAGGHARAQHSDPNKLLSSSPLAQRPPFRTSGRVTSVQLALTASAAAKQQQRTTSSDARRIVTSSPQPIPRRSSTVASQKRNMHPSSSSVLDALPLSASLNSSIEGPRTEPPAAPAPRAATAVRQRTTPITAVTTSRIQSLLPPSKKAAMQSEPALNSSVRVGGVGKGNAGGLARRTAAPTAPSSLASTAGTGFSSKSRKAAAVDKGPKVNSQATLHLTVSTGNVSVGGSVPQPHHSTLRAPNSLKRPATSTTHPLTTSSAAASPPHGGLRQHNVVPPPPLRHTSNSLARRSTTPPGRMEAVVGPSSVQGGGATTGLVDSIAVAFCSQCGQRYVADAKFCAFCGHRREQATATTAVVVDEAPATPPD